MSYINKIELTDIAACQTADSFLQSAMWGAFKARFGWEARAFLIEWENFNPSLILTLSRSLLPGFTFAYVPWGPELPDDFPECCRAFATAEIAQKLKSHLADNTAFIRFEPPWFSAEGELGLHENYNSMLKAGFIKAAATVQPPDTVHINLEDSCEEILARMKPKWRYNISLSAKKGVKAEESSDLETFYSLLKETALRDGIAVHDFNYYKTLFDHYGEISKRRNEIKIRLYTASHEGDVLGAIVVLFRINTATYLYGASSNKKRNLMASYALQWKAIQEAKNAGCTCYDLFGIPPNADPDHPMAGLYLFKTGFGGQIIHRTGTWDYLYRPVIYRLFHFAEAMRKKLRDRKKKRA